MKFAPYSYSRIESFNCPQKFKLSYIDKIKIPSTHDALEKGTRIHQILEFYDDYKKTNILPEFEYDLIKTDERKKEIEDIALNFMISELGLKYFEEQESIGDEIEFGLDKKLNPVPYNSPLAVMRGKIDKIIKSNNHYTIIDWKSGKFPDERWHSNDQAMMYALWFFRKYKEVDEITATYVYVEHNKEHVYKFKREYIQNYATSYSKKITKIETCEDFYKNETKLCDYCDFRKSGYCIYEL
jgi:ATP-dependent exoDNAse (exonuclease V) beta subunit